MCLMTKEIKMGIVGILKRLLQLHGQKKMCFLKSNSRKEGRGNACRINPNFILEKAFVGVTSIRLISNVVRNKKHT